MMLAVIFSLPITIYLSTQSKLTKDQQYLIEQYHEKNNQCRGGDPYADSTWEFCRHRDSLVIALVESGLCFGEDGQAEYQRVWQDCPKGKQ